MKVAFQSHTYDENEYINGSLVTWVHELACNVEHVYVLTLDKPKTKPTRDNITLFAHHRRPGKYATALQAIKNAHKVGPLVDCIFVWQGGHYPALLQASRKPVFQWKAHQNVSWYQDLYSRWCNKTTFTTTPSTYPGRGCVLVTGQGVDTDHFVPIEQEKIIDFLMVCRIASSKKIHMAMAALKACQVYWNRRYKLVVAGPVFTDYDRGYMETLKGLKKDWDIDVEFWDPVVRADVPELLSKTKVVLNLTLIGGLDRSASETMSCGLPLISTNKCTKETLPLDLRAVFGTVYSIQSIAGRMKWFMDMDQDTRQEWGRKARDVALNGHALNRLWDKILPQIRDQIGDQRC